MPLAVYGPRNDAASSREMPRVVCVRSLVPNEKNSAASAMSPARSAARGSSIMVPTWYSKLAPVSFCTASAMATMRSLTRSSSGLVMTSGTITSGMTGCPVALAACDRRLEDGARLHLGNFGERHREAAAAEAEHRVELVQLGGAALQLVGSGAHGRGHFGDLLVRVGQELVQGRVEQPDRDGQAAHDR